MIQIGTIAGAIVGIPQLWGNSNQWWIMYAFEGAFQIIVFCLLFPLHETPRYIPLLFILINLNLFKFSFLLFHKRVEESRESIQFYYGINSDEQIQLIQNEMQNNLKANTNSAGMFAVWRDRKSTTRRGLCIALTLGFCMAFCGVAGE